MKSLLTGAKKTCVGVRTSHVVGTNLGDPSASIVALPTHRPTPGPAPRCQRCPSCQSPAVCSRPPFSPSASLFPSPPSPSSLSFVLAPSSPRFSLSSPPSVTPHLFSPPSSSPSSCRRGQVGQRRLSHQEGPAARFCPPCRISKGLTSFFPVSLLN